MAYIFSYSQNTVYFPYLLNKMISMLHTFFSESCDVRCTVPSGSIEPDLVRTQSGKRGASALLGGSLGCALREPRARKEGHSWPPTAVSGGWWARAG